MAKRKHAEQAAPAAATEPPGPAGPHGLEKEKKKKKRAAAVQPPSPVAAHPSGGSEGALPGAALAAGAAAAAAPSEDAAPQQQPQGQEARAGGGKPAPVLPWMRVPVAIEASEGVLLEQVNGLDVRLRAALQATGIEVLFPVQTVVWQETAGGRSAAHDVCISAPTGSGKTLAYALPLLQALAGRAAPALRAVVVLPTRDLALQVYRVFAGLCPALGLTACVACGKASLAAEAELLGGGGVDVLVATPGRLITHLEGTPGFDGSRLGFLVIDETDRLLRQAYQGWLPKLLAAAQQQGGRAGLEAAEGSGEPQAVAVAGAGDDSSSSSSKSGTSGRLVKFVVSATLTRDPSKLERLGLYCPRYIAMSAVDHRYKLPRALAEYKLVVPADRKPLALAALLGELGAEQTIVFTSSVEATRRLCRLLQALPGLPGRAVVEFSSLLRPDARRAALEDFRSGAAKVLVCSDAMTRGMDVEGVGAVVNYDAPVYAKTYVHRAGRTARAGRSGRVYTLLRHEDVKHFKGMLRKADNTYVRDHKLDRAAMEALRPEVERALQEMQEWVLELGRQQGAGGTQQPQAGPAAAEPAEGKAVRARSKAAGPKQRRVQGAGEFSLLAD